MLLCMLELDKHIRAEQAHAKQHPSPAVAGAVNVLPKPDGDGFILQFNGWAIRIGTCPKVNGECPSGDHGQWELIDTAAEATKQNENQNTQQNP